MPRHKSKLHVVILVISMDGTFVFDKYSRSSVQFHTLPESTWNHVTAQASTWTKLKV